MKVLACGNRDFNDEKIVSIVTLGLGMEAHFRNEYIHLIHGDCRGADRLVAEHVSYETGPTISAYPADWDKIGKSAGYKRNVQMLDEGKPELVLAFINQPLDKCIGTSHMVRLAKKAMLPTYVIEKVA